MKDVKFESYLDGNKLAFVKLPTIGYNIFTPAEATETIFFNLSGNWRKAKTLFGDIDKIAVKIISHESLHLALFKINLKYSKSLDVISGILNCIDYSGFIREDILFDMIKKFKNKKVKRKTKFLK